MRIRLVVLHVEVAAAADDLLLRGGGIAPHLLLGALRAALAPGVPLAQAVDDLRPGLRGGRAEGRAAVGVRAPGRRDVRLLERVQLAPGVLHFAEGGLCAGRVAPVLAGLVAHVARDLRPGVAGDHVHRLRAERPPAHHLGVDRVDDVLYGHPLGLLGRDVAQAQRLREAVPELDDPALDLRHDALVRLGLEPRRAALAYELRKHLLRAFCLAHPPVVRMRRKFLEEIRLPRQRHSPVEHRAVDAPARHYAQVPELVDGRLEPDARAEEMRIEVDPPGLRIGDSVGEAVDGVLAFPVRRERGVERRLVDHHAGRQPGLLERLYDGVPARLVRLRRHNL